MSTAVKIKIYKTVLKPAAVCGSETWAVAETVVNRLGTWYRKILRRLHEPAGAQGIWRIGTD